MSVEALALIHKRRLNPIEFALLFELIETSRSHDGWLYFGDVGAAIDRVGLTTQQAGRVMHGLEQGVVYVHGYHWERDTCWAVEGMRALEEGKARWEAQQEEKQAQAAAERAESNRAGAVYLIRVPETNCYKIGRTANLDNRFKALQSASPHDLELVAFCTTEDMYKTESYLHERFDEQRVKGEWFELEPHELSAIAEIFQAENEACNEL